METNRAASVALKAEVRRIKARLMDEVPKLQKLSQKKVNFVFLRVCFDKCWLILVKYNLCC